MRWGASVVAVVAALVSVSLGSAADPAEAERQYRLARRLSAEGAAGAREALRRVVELDPKGALADDALVDEAALLGSAAWPEELGRVGHEEARRALEILDRVIEGFAGSDRAEEARLRRGLLRLEPCALRDPIRARLDLVSLTSRAPTSPWGLAARYATARLDEEGGEAERARGGYTRLIVDHAGTDAALRALVGLARLSLREGRPGFAAALLQHAVDGGAPEAVRAVPLREAAVRAMLRDVSAGGGWRIAKPRAIDAVVSSASAVAALPTGEFLVADGKRDRVVRIDNHARPVQTWALRDVTALAVDGRGRAFAAAGDGLFRLTGRDAVRVAGLDRFAPASALAADAAGSLYVADRRGDRIGVVAPGKAVPDLVLEERGAGVSALAWDGRRLVAALTSEGVLAEVSSKGALRRLGGVALKKPVALAASAAGEIGVLDGRTGEVLLLAADGTILDRIGVEEAGIDRPGALAIGASGELLVTDGSGGRLVVLP